MKRLTTVIVLLSLLSIGFIGCSDKKKDDDNNPLGPGGIGTSGTITCDINGAVSLNFQSSTGVGNYDETENWLYVGGNVTVNNLHYSIMLEALANTNGTYTIKPMADASDREAYGTFVIASEVPTDEWGLYNSLSGTVTFTSIKNNMQGTFHMVAKNDITGGSVTLSNGSFNVPSFDAGY